MSAEYENLRQALIAATKRIIALEDRYEALAENHNDLVEACTVMNNTIERLTDELEVALGREPTGMSPEQIARSMDSTSWSPGKPTPTNPVERLRNRLADTKYNR